MMNMNDGNHKDSIETLNVKNVNVQQLESYLDLNIEDLDVQELERRLELAAAIPGGEGGGEGEEDLRYDIRFES